MADLSLLKIRLLFLYYRSGSLLSVPEHQISEHAIASVC